MFLTFKPCISTVGVRLRLRRRVAVEKFDADFFDHTMKALGLKSGQFCKMVDATRQAVFQWKRGMCRPYGYRNTAVQELKKAADYVMEKRGTALPTGELFRLSVGALSLEDTSKHGKASYGHKLMKLVNYIIANEDQKAKKAS
jgi:hypothetical protein